jgi:hypothetical protein
VIRVQNDGLQQLLDEHPALEVGGFDPELVDARWRGSGVVQVASMGG